MIRISALYPATPGSRFDWDYYLGAHSALVHKLCDPLGMVKLEIDRGIAGLPPGTPAPFHAVGYLTWATMSEMQAALASAAPEVLADLPNFTDVQPTILISEVA
jgi:uncharacterized protein (TIGR02118 family)